MTAVPSKAASQRQLRVGEELRHALAAVMGRGEFQDPRLRDQVITVTEVKVSPDLKQASAYVLPLGGFEAGPTVDALNHAAGFLRGQVARMVKLRHTPRLVFVIDRSFETAERMETLFSHPKVRRDLERSADSDPDAGAGDQGEN